MSGSNSSITGPFQAFRNQNDASDYIIGVMMPCHDDTQMMPQKDLNFTLLRPNDLLRTFKYINGTQAHFFFDFNSSHNFLNDHLVSRANATLHKCK